MNHEEHEALVRKVAELEAVKRAIAKRESDARREHLDASLECSAAWSALRQWQDDQVGAVLAKNAKAKGREGL